MRATKIKTIKSRKSRDYPISPFAEALKHAQRLTAGLRCAPPVGRRLGLGPSLGSVRAVAEGRIATACAFAEVCPVAQPASRSRRLLFATAAPALQVRKPAGR